MTTADNIVRVAAEAGDVPLPSFMRTCRIDITNESDAVLAIAKAVNDGTSIPGLYSRNGKVVEVAEVDPGTGPKLIIPILEADRLRHLLAQHTHCFQMKMVKKKVKGDDGKDTTIPVPVEVPALPAVSTSRAALAAHEWNGVRQLAGVVTMPIVRPDGSVGTTKGYDRTTKLYYWPSFKVADVPERPTAEQVAEAKRFLFEDVLGDFLWDSDASRANYVAMLFTPLMRLYIRGLAPLGLISAATRGSGKSLLTEIIRAAYGMHMTTWARREDEFRKKITGILKDSTEPVVVFDNVEVTDTIAHGTLSMLLTSREWSDRLLGVNDSVTCVNDRLWLATGNNLAVGGDVASRSVLIRLDPQMERPETRKGFRIEKIWEWLAKDENRARILWSLLVLARAWLAAEAPRAEKTMRNFTNWAEAMGGLVAFLGLPGFLDNTEELTVGSDDGETMTAAFIVKWYELFGDRWVTTRELSASAQVESAGGQTFDKWGGDFLSKEERGMTIPYSARGLGKFLDGRRDRIFCGIKLSRSESRQDNTWKWRVQKLQEG